MKSPLKLYNIEERLPTIGRKVLFLLRLREGIFSHVDGFLLGRLKAPRGMRINSDFKQALKKKNEFESPKASSSDGSKMLCSLNQTEILIQME
jgi:hypothetical protein